MNDSIIRYQFNPTLTDTAGFFDYCIPITNESARPAADSLLKYYDFSVYNYIAPAPTNRQFIQSTSVFGKHSLSPIHPGPLPINRQSADWMTLVFIVCLFIIAWIQTFYPKRLQQIFRAAAQQHFVNQMEREGNLLRERITLGLGFIYYLLTSMFIFQLCSEYKFLPTGINNFTFTSIIFATILLYQLLKSLLVYLSGIIFNTSESARNYQLNTLLFNHIIGIVLFPVVVLAFYWNSQVCLTFGIVSVSFILLYRLFRGVVIGLSNKNYNLFYLFLYLCTLEILPLLLLFKVVSKI